MQAEPQQQHSWLKQIVGEWELEHYVENGEKKDGDWAETVRMIGDLWVAVEGRGSMPDGDPVTTLMTVGYDPEKERFVGSWVGSMMTKLWTYEGEVDDSGRILTLSSEGPDFENPDRVGQYHDIMEFDGDRRIFRSEYLGKDGTWKEMMRMQLRRV